MTRPKINDRDPDRTTSRRKKRIARDHGRELGRVGCSRDLKRKIRTRNGSGRFE
jgi:hypothetical protein